MLRRYLLTIAGCPFAFSDSTGLPGLSSSSPLWHAPASVAEGTLVRPMNRWVERAKPLDGDLDVDAQRFQIHDARVTVDGAVRSIVSWLATRSPASVTSTPLAASISAAATTFTVGDASALTIPGYAWIEGECIETASAAGNVVTVATRGALGTKAAAHTIDAAQAIFPEVFATLPWVVRRKVCLWSIDATGVCTLLWVGFASRAPTLSDDGARFDLACDHAWTTLRQNPVGGSLGATRAVGYGTSIRTGSAGALLTTSFWLTYGGAVYRGNARSPGPHRDWDALARHHERQFATDTTRAGARIDIHIARSGATARVDGDVLTATVPTFGVATTVGGKVGEPQTSTARGSRQAVSYELRELPSVLYLTIEGASTLLLVTGLATLPSSWSSSTSTDGAYTTLSTPGLRCQYSERLSLLLTGVTANDSGATGPRVEGTAVLLPRKPGMELSAADQVVVLRDPPPLQVVYRVRADHWAYGLRRAVVGLCEDAHPDDWDWTGVDAVAADTAGLRVARDWIFDGRRTLGETVTEACLLHGCSPVLRSGRLALHAWAWPDAQRATSATLASADIIGLPSWSRWQEGLANRLTLKSPDLTLDASQAQSRARYGPGRQIRVDLAGLDDQASPIGDPLDFARSVVGRLELWSEPLAVVRLKLSGAWIETFELGRELTASEWMLPDGAGSRGLVATRAVVIGREVDLASATLTVEALIFGHRSYPYAPCGRVATQVTTSIVTLATAFVGGTSTYSGGNDAKTFHVGDKCDLVSREATPVIDAGVTIIAIDTTLRKITFASPMSAGIQARIAAGAVVDLRFATYSTPVVASQEAWMFVGDDTTRVIDGTTDTAREIAP